MLLRVSQLTLAVGHSPEALRKAASRKLACPAPAMGDIQIIRRAIDARGKMGVRFSYTLDIPLEDAGLVARALKQNGVAEAPDERYRQLDGLPALAAPPTPAASSSSQSRPVVVGTGPCGLLAGLLLARAGRCPILLERGKAAGPRARDVTGFWRRGAEFQPESNVQYGEGGAGTFSDGKLYTQIRDPQHRIPWLLREFVKAGAPEDILTKARPHIGTDRLIKVVRHIREEILSLGGDIRFEQRVDHLQIENNAVQGLTLASGEEITTDTVILAIGHSARDTVEMLHRCGVPMEPKTFSVGVRIEHQQALIDRSQFGDLAGHPDLGSAPYKFAAKTSTDRSAYSFCMCPGGLVVAAASEPGSVVTNGMSSYARSESNANAGYMVEIGPSDYGASPDDLLAGITFQRKLERAAFVAGGSDFKAPAQLLGDFLNGKASRGVGEVVPSYEPGVVWTDLTELLPPVVVRTLQEAVKPIAKRLRGFDHPEAVLTGLETRSSSPIRIPRDSESNECIGVAGLYPAGEGAGYAGGIISAAADGMRVAEGLLRREA